MLVLYQTVLLPLRLAATVLAAWHSHRHGRHVEWKERRATVLPQIRPGGLWIHGASMGESILVKGISAGIRRIRPDIPLAVSATTVSGREQLPGPPAVDSSFYSPLDFAGSTGRVLDAVQPAGLVLVETELWPNLIHQAAARSIPVTIVNGRLAPERMFRYRLLSSLYRPVLRRITRIGAQSEDDAERFRELGVDPRSIDTTGNLKYDIPVPRIDSGALRRRFALAPDRPVVVAGSTGAGEEEPVLDAFLAVRRTVPDLFLVLAPRHPERAADARRLAGERGIDLHTISGGNDDRAGGKDGLLVDTIGELTALYTLGIAAFVGGSLVPVGGHNVLEPVALDTPVLFGPHTEHVAEPAGALESAGGAIRVHDSMELARGWERLAVDREYGDLIRRNGRAVLDANRGAMRRTIDLILEMIGDGNGSNREELP